MLIVIDIDVHGWRVHCTMYRYLLFRYAIQIKYDVYDNKWLSIVEQSVECFVQMIAIAIDAGGISFLCPSARRLFIPALNSCTDLTRSLSIKAQCDYTKTMYRILHTGH